MSGPYGYSDDAARELTPRMRDVLVRAAAGRTAAETALELGLSRRTVENVLAVARLRLHAANTVAAVDLARRRELL